MTESDTTALRLARGADATARAWLEAGAPAGAPPAPSATVCVLRPSGDGVEVLWITRGRRMRSWPGLLAFPGGTVDPADRARRPDDHAPPDRFTVLARAAARECEEETGLVVASRALRPFARWVTPEHEPRRYDTTFLAAAVPGGTPVPSAPAGDPDGEVHDRGWAAPDRLLAEVVDGTRAALPPTRAVLGALVAGAGSVLSGASPPDDPWPDDDVAGRVVAAVVAAGSLVPVVPRAAWRDGPPGGDGRPDVDLLLPRHAGEVP